LILREPVVHARQAELIFVLWLLFLLSFLFFNKINLRLVKVILKKAPIYEITSKAEIISANSYVIGWCALLPVLFLLVDTLAVAFALFGVFLILLIFNVVAS
jgi:hypothetical protein